MTRLIDEKEISSDSLSPLYNKLVNQICSYEKQCRCLDNIPDANKQEACKKWITTQNEVFSVFFEKLKKKDSEKKIEDSKNQKSVPNPNNVKVNKNSRHELKQKTDNENKTSKIKDNEEMFNIQINYANNAKYLIVNDETYSNNNGFFNIEVPKGIYNFKVLDFSKKTIAEFKQKIDKKDMQFACDNQNCICVKNCN